MKKLLLLPTLFLILSLSFAQDRIVKLDTDGDTPGELRYEINNSEPGDIIIIDEKVQNIVLEKGEIEIPHDLHITGQEKAPTTITGNGTSRIFNFTQMEVPSQEGIFDVVLNKTHPGSLVEHLVLTNGVSEDPQVGGEGGAIRLNNRSAFFRKVIFQDNKAISGGAVSASGGELIFEYCTFNNNTAENEEDSYGGAIYYINPDGGQSFTLHTLKLFGSSLLVNQSINGPGGAIYIQDDAGTFEYYIENSTFYKNKGAGGGALAISDYIGKSNGFIDQCTFSGNTDMKEGGGAIRIESQGNLSINHSTITENTSAYGGGGIYTAFGRVSLYSTIVSNNKLDTNTDLTGSEDLYAENESAITSGGYNFLGTNSISFLTETNNEVIGDDPQLEPLAADNGGPTLTHIPSEKSLVIDAGDPGFRPEGEQYDQRGEPFVRFFDDKIIDIGAVEWQVNCTRPNFDAGPDLEVCADSVIFRPSNTPSGWESTWSIAGNSYTYIKELADGRIQVGSNDFIQIGQISVPLSLPSYDSTVVVWVLNSGGCLFTDSLVIKRDQAPYADIFYQNRETFCADTTGKPHISTSGNSDSLRWSVISGVATILNPTSEYDKLITGIGSGDSASIEIAVYTGVCPAVRDTMTLVREAEITPEISIANLSSSTCTDSIHTFHADVNIKNFSEFDGTINWQINGIHQTNHNDTIATFSNLSDQDTIAAIFEQHYSCASVNEVTSNSIILNLYPQAVAGTIASNSGSTCLNDTILVGLNGSKGENIEWFQSLNEGTYAPITSGLINDTTVQVVFDDPSINDIRVYAQVSNACNETTTEIYSLYLEPSPTAGTITPSSLVVCEGEELKLKTTNSIADEYIWQESIDTLVWTTIPNATDDSLSLTPTTNTYYRFISRIVETSCPRDTSNHTLITVSTQPHKATLSPDMTICSGQLINLKASGSLDQLDWFVSSDGGETFTKTVFPNMVGDSIASQVLLENTDPTPLAYYIYVQSSNSCDSINSDTMVVTVDPLPVIDPPAPVVECGRYTLPPITGVNLSGNQAYFTAPDGQGIPVLAGTEILSDTLLYAFDISAAGCFSESLVNITITAQPTINIGPDQSICASNSSVLLNSTIGGGATGVLWSTNGTGTFSSATTLTTTYTLSASDLLLGQITIYATSENSPSCNKEMDSLSVNISPSPTVNAGPDQTISCYDGTGITMNGTITNATGAIWSNYEGTFTPNEADLNATYFPSSNEIANGAVQLVLTSDENNLCPPGTDTVDLMITTYDLSVSDDVATIFSGDSAVVAILTNDLIEGGISDISLITPTTSGTAYITDANQLVFVPEFGFSGEVTLDYLVVNECGITEQAKVTITVTNNAPVANDTTVTLENQSSLTFDIRDFFTDAENNILFDSASILTNATIGSASISGFNVTLDYSTTIGTIDSFYVKVLDAGNETATALIRIILSESVVGANAGADKTIKTYSTTLNADPVFNASTYWSPVNGLVFNDITSPKAEVSGFKPEKSPYLLVWNVDNGNTISSDTVKITVVNVPPVVINAKNVTVKQKITIINLDSLVADSNRNISSIKIITPFSNLDNKVVSIDNEALTITIDLNKSGISDTTNIVDSLEYEVCDVFNTCARSYITVLREGIDINALTRIEEIVPNTIYNFLSPNNDILNSNFFFDIEIIKSNGDNLIVDIVTDNETNGVLRHGPDFENTFSKLIERIEVVIFNRWGDQIISFDDYYGGEAYNNGEIVGNEVPDKYVWKGKDKNGNNLVNGTYYFYVKIISRVSEESSTSGFIELRD